MRHEITRHKIGTQSSPPAVVLLYENEKGLRKRVMPLRGLETLGSKASAKLLTEAHKEWLRQLNKDQW